MFPRPIVLKMRFTAHPLAELPHGPPLSLKTPNAFRVPTGKLRGRQGGLKTLLRSRSTLVAVSGQRDFHSPSCVVAWASGSPGVDGEPLNGRIPALRTEIWLWCPVCSIQLPLHLSRQSTLLHMCCLTVLMFMANRQGHINLFVSLFSVPRPSPKAPKNAMCRRTRTSLYWVRLCPPHSERGLAHSRCSIKPY